MGIPIEYLSHSRIEMYRKNPVLYKKTYIDKQVQREASPAMALGSLLHARLLEPETFDDKFAVAPMVDKRTKAGKEAFEKFQESLSSEVTIITHDDVSQSTRMLDAIRENTASSYFLDSPTAVKEQEINITSKVDGMDIGFKFICDVYDPERGFVVDVKTVSSYDPLDWAKECVFSGYLRQLALYRFLLRYNQVPITSCVHIVVDKGEFPTCMVVEFDSSDIDKAENQVITTIRKMVESHETNQFLPHYYGIVPKLVAPAWSWRV
jgi:hypothetical protein